jgi:uncharacterized protein
MSSDPYLQAWRARARVAEAQASAWRAARCAEAEGVARALVERLGARRVVLFGSLARGSAGPESDVDLWVEGLPEGAYLEAVSVAREGIARVLTRCYTASVRPELIDELLAHYRAALGPHLVGLAMYGSRARGDARPDSDLDLLLIADGLPADLFERARVVQAPLVRLDDPSVSVRALSPGEYERDIAPIDLDIGLDGVVLHDRDGYLSGRLELVRQRIQQAGLVRAADLTWGWRQWPSRADWAVTWEGVRL